jgi:hypothetical protein
VAERPECMPIFTFALWSLIKDFLGPTVSHKASLVFKLGCGLAPYNQPGSIP